MWGGWLVERSDGRSIKVKVWYLYVEYTGICACGVYKEPPHRVVPLPQRLRPELRPALLVRKLLRGGHRHLLFNYLFV